MVYSKKFEDYKIGHAVMCAISNSFYQSFGDQDQMEFDSALLWQKDNLEEEHQIASSCLEVGNFGYFAKTLAAEVFYGCIYDEDEDLYKFFIGFHREGSILQNAREMGFKLENSEIDYNKSIKLVTEKYYVEDFSSDFSPLRDALQARKKSAIERVAEKIKKYQDYITIKEHPTVWIAFPDGYGGRQELKNFVYPDEGVVIYHLKTSESWRGGGYRSWEQYVLVENGVVVDTLMNITNGDAWGIVKSSSPDFTIQEVIKAVHRTHI